MIGKIKNEFEFVNMHYPFNEKRAIRIVEGTHSLQQYQEYINKQSLDMAEIIMPNLEILNLCPTLKHLRIIPSCKANTDFDFDALYELNEVMALNCQNKYGSRGQYIGNVDYSRINGLVELSVGINNGTLNYNKIETLKSLSANGFKGKKRDLTDLFCSRELDTLKLIGCGMRSLNGIENSHKMQCLYLHYNRSLENIEALDKVSGTLRALRIENCPQIKDFSVLGCLENLELLELSGNNILQNLDFLKRMKNLKTFVFNVHVLSGDLSPCLGLLYVYSEKNRKHYNLKDVDLPKSTYVRGNENIELWRRLE